MVAFHCDLDNTLIFSYKQDIGTPKTCVEWYEGREISYMLPSSLTLLQQLKDALCFVPTTTRTLAQYRRIDLGFTPDYSLVCNGGVLLHRGTPDAQWYQESLALVQDVRDEMAHGLSLLQSDPDRNFEVRYIEELFAFTKSAQPERTAARLRALLPCPEIAIHQNGAKVYLLPKKLHKGQAVQRLRHRLQPSHTIAAGDSDFDHPLLCAADWGFAPGALYEGAIFEKPGHVTLLTEPFYRSLLPAVLAYTKAHTWGVVPE